MSLRDLIAPICNHCKLEAVKKPLFHMEWFWGCPSCKLECKHTNDDSRHRSSEQYISIFNAEALKSLVHAAPPLPITSNSNPVVKQMLPSLTPNVTRCNGLLGGKHRYIMKYIGNGHAKECIKCNYHEMRPTSGDEAVCIPLFINGAHEFRFPLPSSKYESCRDCGKAKS